MEALGSWYALWMGGRERGERAGLEGPLVESRKGGKKEGKGERKEVHGRTYVFALSWLL